MTRRRAITLGVDVAMTLCMLWMMSYPVTRGLLRHGISGICLLVLIVLHHLINLHWYRALLHGRWNSRRILTTVTGTLLILAFGALSASALVMAGDVFPFAPFAMPWWGRSLHGASASWLFVLASFHLGLHGNHFWKMVHRILQHTFGRAYFLVIAVTVGACALAFWNSELWMDMFLLERAGGYPAQPIFGIQLLGSGAFFCIVARICDTIMQLHSHGE